jgi:copper(I)-binding protein
MKSWFVACGFVLAALLSQSTAFAHGYSKGELSVRHPWTRATPPGTTVGAGYLEIRNSGTEPDRLIGASTPAAKRVELHVLIREGDIVRMSEVKSLEVPARQRLILRPNVSHLMIVGLGKPLVKGARVPLTLRFEKAGELQIELEVQALDSRKAHH